MNGDATSKTQYLYFRIKIEMTNNVEFWQCILSNNIQYNKVIAMKALRTENEWMMDAKLHDISVQSWPKVP